jgi:hypothetical protein
MQWDTLKIQMGEAQPGVQHKREKIGGYMERWND